MIACWTQLGRVLHCDNCSSRSSGGKGSECLVQSHKVDALLSYKADAEG